jgi:hypothetical protein
LWKALGREARGMNPLRIRTLPPVDPGYVRFVASDESAHDVPEKWLAAAYTIDPELRTIPGPDENQLVLTGEDCALLWVCGIENP